MRLKDHLGIFLVILLVVTVLQFGVFTGYQTVQGIDAGIMLPVNYRGLNPNNFPDNTPLIMDVAVKNYGNVQTIGTVSVTAELYDLSTNTYITGISTTTNNYLNSGSSDSVTFNFGILPAGNYGVGIRISATNDVDSSNDVHPEIITVVATTPPPALVDLAIASINYPVSSNYNTGQNVVFDVQVTNLLNGVTSNDITVVAKVYDSVGNNILTVSETEPSGLGGGQSVLIPFNLGNTLLADNYYIEFEVFNADDSVINQYNTATSNFNVIQTAPLTNVDFAIKPVIFPGGANSYQTNQNIQFSVEATNIGTSATSNPVMFTAKILDGSGAVLVQDTKQASTSANAGQTVSASFSFNPLASTDYGLNVEVINADDVILSNNIENTGFKVVPVTQPVIPDPDLEMVSVQINNYASNQIPANTQFSAEIDYQNIGQGDTRSHPDIDFGIIDTAGNLVFTDTFSLNKHVLTGQQGKATINLIGVPAGNYNLIAMIDYLGLTGDPDTSNNIISIPITVVGVPVPSICNDNDICEADNGEDGNNCVNDCSFGNDLVFCNSADKSDGVSVGGMLQFTDANSVDHSVILNSLSFATKSFQLNYDGSNINMNLRTPKVTSDYEVRVPVIGVEQGKNFVFVCFKVKTLLPVSGQCNNNKICESTLGENINTCQLDCIATPANVQFCSASNKIDYARTLTLGQSGQSVDQYNQPHIIKFVSVDKTGSKVKIQYDKDVLDLTPGTPYSIAKYELLPLLVNEDMSSVTQSLMTKAFLCAKHKAKLVGTQTGSGTQTGTAPSSGTVTGVQFFNINLIAKDKDSKQPVESVKVNFYVYIQFTDSAGKAAFNMVPKGIAKYKLSSAGYKTLDGEIDITKSGDLIFELEKGVSTDFPILETIIDKAQIIVGKRAMPADVFTAELLKKSLSKNSVVLKNGKPVLQVGIISSNEKIPMNVELDDSANIYLPNTHSILIGSACNNKLTKATLELTAGEDCNKGVIPGQARIQLKTLHGGKTTIMLIYGINEEDTRMAAQALVRGLKETLIGTDFRVSQEFGDLKITKLG